MAAPERKKLQAVTATDHHHGNSAGCSGPELKGHGALCASRRYLFLEAGDQVKCLSGGQEEQVRVVGIAGNEFGILSYLDGEDDVGGDGVHSVLLAFVRSMGEGGEIAPPTLERSRLARGTPFVRFVRGRDDVLRILRAEVCDDFVRDVLTQNPGRTLRLDRTRVRSAEVGANDLAIDAELIGDLLWPEGHWRVLCLGHSFVPFARCYIRLHPERYRVRSFVSGSIVRSLHNLYISCHPPHRPPQRVRLTWRRGKCRAKRAGCLIFGNLRAAYGAYYAA